MDLLGVNLAGADFGSVGQAYGTGYTYPTHAEIDYYAAEGMNVIRLPFLWERLQPTLNGPLDKAELARIDDVVSYATSKGLKIDLDVHNYGKYNGQLIGSAAVPTSAFANLWGQIAGHFASNSNVIFGLMNEPQVSDATSWLTSVNAAIGAIRSTGAAQEVLVPGINWDGAWTWAGSPNATVLAPGIVDPLKNYAFEVHQYLDGDGSGTTSQVASTQTGVQRLTAVTQWAEQTGNKLFLGEFGAATDSTSLSALTNMLGYMNQHTDAWQGATYWAGGPWWWNSNIYGIEPDGLGTSNVTDKPQMAILKQYEGTAVASTTVPTLPATASTPAAPVTAPAPVAPTDPGPVVTPSASLGALEIGQSEVIATVAPGLAGQTVALRQTGGVGTLSLGAVRADGTMQVTYTAPQTITASGSSALTYVLTDTQSGVATTASAAVPLDAGPALSSTTPAAVGHGQTVTIGTVTPGQAGDTLSLTLVGNAPAGSIRLSGTSVLYTAPSTVAAGQKDTVSYKITDQHNDAVASASTTLALDPGPTVGAVSITVGHGQTTDVTSALRTAAKPGLAGDQLSLVAVSGGRGSVSFANGTATYTAPAAGADVLTYSIADQIGDVVQGRATVTVDPGPTTGVVSSTVKLGASVDLSAAILAAATPGLKGDQLTIQAVNTGGTLGSVSRVNGGVVYTASGNALAQIPGGGTGSDNVGYTVADQYGDVATGTATPSITAPVAVVATPVAATSVVAPAPVPVVVTPAPSSTPAPVAVASAAVTPAPTPSAAVTTLSYSGYSNVITFGSGNYTIAAGQGSARVSLGDGNDTVRLAGYSNTVFTGNGNDVVTGSNGSTTVKLGDGNNSVNLGGYGNVVTVGAGTNTIVAGNGAKVTAGAGTDQIALAGYGNTVTLNGSTATVAGGQGNDTITANGGNVNLTVNNWANHIILNGATNAAILDAGHVLKLDIGSSSQTDTITGFGSDGFGVVDFSPSVGFNSVADIMAALHSDNHGGTMLAMGTGSVDFLGTAQNLLHAWNFKIG